MAGVKAAEVSAILKKQLSGFEASATLDEVGTVLQVGDGIARVYGLSKAQAGELVTFENGVEAIKLIESSVKFQLILMDIKMPVMNGYEATKEIKKLNKLI